MTDRELESALRKSALQYAKVKKIDVNSTHMASIIFDTLADNFNPQSFAAIQKNPGWNARTKKKHPAVPGAYEMQSSNSSDAILMNIFCHPDVGKWKGILDLLQVTQLAPSFGFKAGVKLKNGKLDRTEIDMVVDDLFFEAKLTEEDFTEKSELIVEQYDELTKHFYATAMKRGALYDNYQIIRNLLAALQYGKRHILLCDERRPDLARKYMETVSCLQDINARLKCRVVFWQEIKRACGANLKLFLEEKYAM